MGDVMWEHRPDESTQDVAETSQKAAPIDLARDLSTCAGLQVIGRACLKQISGNAPAVIQGDPEGVHQMRVGVRRFRAAMSLFAALLHDPQSAAIKRELKWLARELAPAREFDVLIERVVMPAKKRAIRRWSGIPGLVRALLEQREQALAKAQKSVTSVRFRKFTRQLTAWLEAGQWTRPEDDLACDLGQTPIEVFAAEQLTRRWRKACKERRPFAQMDPPSRHRLRIETKKLRYAAEFFARLFPDKKASKRKKKFLTALERLQNSLGELNDIAVDETIITEIGIRRQRSDTKRAFATGLLTGREDARLDAAMAAATEAYGDLVKVKPFWR
jgi:CHAD domain-containing protein